MKKIVVVGSINQDYVAQVDNIAQVGETVLAKSYELFPGGKGANQAYAIGKLGGSVSLLGAVGNDEQGNYLLNNLSSVGVDVRAVKIHDREHTGVAWITVDKAGDNSITVIQGANKAVDIQYIENNIAVIEQADIVVMQLEIPLETVVHTAKRAKSLGKQVFLDPAPAVNNLPNELFSNVDLIKPNETELCILTGTSLDDEDYAKKVDVLKRMGAKQVVVTLGAKGTYLGNGNGSLFEAHRVKAIDTTAAGDGFTAALTVALSHGESIEDAISFAQRVSSIIVTRKGAQSSIPSIDELS